MPRGFLRCGQIYVTPRFDRARPAFWDRSTRPPPSVFFIRCPTEFFFVCGTPSPFFPRPSPLPIGIQMCVVQTCVSYPDPVQVDRFFFSSFADSD